MILTILPEKEQDAYMVIGLRRKNKMKKRLPQANIKNNKDHYFNDRGYHVINLQLTPIMYQNLKRTATTEGLPIIDIIRMAIVQHCKGATDNIDKQAEEETELNNSKIKDIPWNRLIMNKEK